MKVSQLARRAGVTPDTVRHYERIGLLFPSRDPDNGYRAFSRRDLVRLQFIRRARQLGFRLEEVRLIFSIAQAGRSPCPQARDIVAKRIDETHLAVQQLQVLQRRLELALRDWSCEPDRAPTGDSICYLIENWNNDD